MSDVEEVADNLLEEETDPYAQSIAEKMQIARNVVIQCERLHKSSARFYSDDIQNITRYTGVHEKKLKLADMTLTQEKTFSSWYDEQQPLDADSIYFTYGSIRNLIIDVYTRQLQLATKAVVINTFKTLKLWMKQDHLRLKRNIYAHGFEWKRLPGTKKSILVERTDQSLKKLEYLTRMKAYREAGRSIVYVDPHFYHNHVAVSPQYGLLSLGYHCLKNEENSPEVSNETWIKNVLIPIIPSNSVVVLKEDPQAMVKIPTPTSSKEEMINWLEKRKVPHHPSLHKADLYSLINKFKHLADSDSLLDKMLTAYGHDVIYRPNLLADIDYLVLMWPGPRAQRYKSDTFVKLKERTLEDWQNIEKIIIEREEKLYQEQILLETITDKLLTLTKKRKLKEEELAECDDELFLDDYYSSIIYK